MTNTINKMAGKNSVERCNGSASKTRSKRTQSKVVSIPPMMQQRQRQSPTTSPAGGRGSPKSPGLQLFAGAKWTEPPAPTALPPPPVHWTQQSRAPLLAHLMCGNGEKEVVHSQLKMLLQLQA